MSNYVIRSLITGRFFNGIGHSQPNLKDAAKFANGAEADNFIRDHYIPVTNVEIKKLSPCGLAVIENKA